MGQAPSSHVRVLVLLGRSDDGEADNADPAEGKRIVDAVRQAGGRLTIEDGNIALRWTRDMPGAGGLIDRIRANRTGVVAALTEGQAAGP